MGGRQEASGPGGGCGGAGVSAQALESSYGQGPLTRRILECFLGRALKKVEGDQRRRRGEASVGGGGAGASAHVLRHACRGEGRAGGVLTPPPRTHRPGVACLCQASGFTARREACIPGGQACACHPFLFLLEPGFQQFKVAERLHANWIRLYLESSNSEVLVSLGAKVRRQYLDTLRTLSLSLSRQVAHYDAYSMAVGTVVVLEVRCSW